MARRQTEWFAIGFDAWLLGMEAAQVVWLRSWVILLGGTRAQSEANLMIEEKLAANAAFGWALVSGGAGQSSSAIARRALSHYGSRVRANARRLGP